MSKVTRNAKKVNNATSRRVFLKLAATAAGVGMVSRGQAQTIPATQPGATATGPAGRGGGAGGGGGATANRVPAVPLGNAEAPALTFQAYPGGTGAYFEKLLGETGPRWGGAPGRAVALARVPMTVEPWNGAVPTADEDIAFQPVHRLAALLQAGKLSPVDLTQIYLERLKKWDDKLLCAVTIMEGPAKEAARQAEREIKAGNYKGPLHGIPWGVKDLFATKGIPTTWGAREFETRVIDDDAEVVRRLTNAGAILIAKLATGRFALGDQWYRGRTNNPWNIAAGSSGSSAGPASATAAGCVGFAIGTETRGSIVSPAARCGLCALRPTYGQVSRAGGMVLAWSMDRVGPFARSAEDCALVFNVIHGVDENDPSTLTTPFQFVRNPTPADMAKLRIGYDRGAPADFVAKLKELGADPRMIGTRPMINGLESIDPESAAAFRGDLTSGVLQDVDTPNGTVGKGRFTNGLKLSAADFLDIQRRREILVHRMADFMKDLDLYVSGTGEAGGDVTLCSLTGHPAVILPSSFGSVRNAPAQPRTTTLIGDLFGEEKILSVASAFQGVTDFHTRRPAFPG